MEKEEDSDDTFGGWHPIKDIKDPSLEVLAKFAISKYSKQKNSRLNFETVVSGDELEVAGMKYRLVLNVNDGCNEGTNIYEAEVYIRAWDDYSELIYMKPIN
ncbi:hypothetical protein F2Q69_00005568 [Brassica cretica]|uniref:Cystatin domain-containing protein n=1 Tax=Brassica cretica TaxID=69181 RepID=A0A8S9P5N4_BRACR|nr:hypothetical protein F2Q69_00005568 [Brassica cretica]